MCDLNINPNLIPEAVNTAATNILDKPTKAIGQTFAELWYLIFGGIVHQAAVKRETRYAIEAEKFKEEVLQKVNAIPEDKHIEPDFQTVSVALNDAKFCLENEEIRTMFANLIASASDSTKADNALPIFSDIIKKMTSRDASNLASFGNVSNHPIAIYRQWLNKTNHVDIMRNVFILNKKYLDLPMQSVSINTLCTLGLVEINYNEKFSASAYSDFYETREYKDLVETCKNMNQFIANNLQSLPPEILDHLSTNSRMEIIGGTIKLTDLGSMFKKVCLP